MQTDDVRKIAIYGKGGVGKSTVSANLSAALSHMGEKVMQVGCDPKRDSIATLCGRLVPTIMDQVAKHRTLTPELLDEVIFTGYNGIKGCESGGPKPGMGCAGKGVNLALNELLDHHKMFQKHGISFAIFDVLGDVVCGGFSQPMRSGYAREIYLVTCGEILTLYQVNNITKAVAKLSHMGIDVGVAGIINNMRGVLHEEEIVEEFGNVIGVPVIQHIPRSRFVQDAELQGKTVIEAHPNSEQADVYRSLATKILKNSEVHIPIPTDMKTLKKIASSF